MALQSQPWQDPVLADKPWTMSYPWGTWFDALRAKIAGAFAAAGNTVALTVAVSSAPATALVTAVPLAAIYRVNYLAQVTRAATTSSSLQATVRWTSNGVAQARSGAALVGNLLTTQDTDVFLIAADANTSITIETAYASVGATAMRYRLDASVETV